MLGLVAVFSGLPKGTQVTVVFVLFPLLLPYNPIRKTCYCSVFELSLVGSSKDWQMKSVTYIQGKSS